MLAAALRRFSRNPRDPLLNAHRLKGDHKDYWEFSVDQNLRVAFRWHGDEAFLVSIGSQAY